MKLITFAGSHACGKTAAILKACNLISSSGKKTGVMKLDCISSGDDFVYKNNSIPCLKYICGNMCPDHFFASHVPEIFQWGLENNLDVLITESAGLCGRCAPHIKEVPAVCVIDCLAGITSPLKAGPMLFYADYIVITKSDLVSPAEREVFLKNVRYANSRAKITFINGLSGQGAYRLSSFILNSNEIDSVNNKFLRFTMPAASCNFCSGQMWIGTNNSEKKSAGGRIKWPLEEVL